nr:leucine-rich repeat domain-containing protein [uncultured Flavobacterium sp.]
MSFQENKVLYSAKLESKNKTHMRTIFKITLFLVAVFFISSCTHKKTEISETKDLDTIECPEIVVKEKPIIINQDSIFKQLGVRVFKDSNFVFSAKELKSNSIPDWVFKMKMLKHISINGMFPEYIHEDYGAYHIKDDCYRIQEIPPQIKELSSLTSLSLFDNDIQTIPIELSTLKKLKIIDLSNNSGLENVDNIEKIASLEFLSFYGCHLTEMPANIGTLKHLKELDLQGNSINGKEQIRIKKALPNCKIRF